MDKYGSESFCDGPYRIRKEKKINIYHPLKKKSSALTSNICGSDKWLTKDLTMP